MKKGSRIFARRREIINLKKDVSWDSDTGYDDTYSDGFTWSSVQNSFWTYYNIN